MTYEPLRRPSTVEPVEDTAARWARLVEARAALRCVTSTLRNDWLRSLGMVDSPETLAAVEDDLGQIGGTAVEVAGQSRGLIPRERHAFLPMWRPWNDGPTPEPAGARFTTYRPDRHRLALTAHECAEVIDACATLDPHRGRGGGGTGDLFFPTLPPSVAAKVWGLCEAASASWWPSPVARIDAAVLRRELGSRQPFHTDRLPGEGARRNVSLIVTLSAPEDYEGGEIVFQWGGSPHVLRRPEPGHVVAFPADLVHGVETVLGGARWSLVAWAEM